jgi:hypothetical protein
LPISFWQDRASDPGPSTRAASSVNRAGYPDPNRHLHYLPTTGPLEGGFGRQEEPVMMTLMTHRQIYVRTVLNLYVQLPDTSSRWSLKDRALADHFFERQIPIDIVERALLLGSARRIFRSRPPMLPPIRSLAYFASIVEELLPHPFPPDSLYGLRLGDDGDPNDVAEHDPGLPF